MARMNVLNSKDQCEDLFLSFIDVMLNNDLCHRLNAVRGERELFLPFNLCFLDNSSKCRCNLSRSAGKIFDYTFLSWLWCRNHRQTTVFKVVHFTTGYLNLFRRRRIFNSPFQNKTIGLDVEIESPVQNEVTIGVSLRDRLDTLTKKVKNKIDHLCNQRLNANPEFRVILNDLMDFSDFSA